MLDPIPTRNDCTEVKYRLAISSSTADSADFLLRRFRLHLPFPSWTTQRAPIPRNSFFSNQPRARNRYTRDFVLFLFFFFRPTVLFSTGRSWLEARRELDSWKMSALPAETFRRNLSHSINSQRSRSIPLLSSRLQNFRFIYRVSSYAKDRVRKTFSRNLLFLVCWLIFESMSPYFVNVRHVSE